MAGISLKVKNLRLEIFFDFALLDTLGAESFADRKFRQKKKSRN